MNLQNQDSNRIAFDDELRLLLGKDINIYWDPPSNKYVKGDPRIIYERDRPNISFADNRIYACQQCYMITVLYTDPDCNIPQIINEHFKYSRIERNSYNDNMYHTVIKIYW